MAIGNGAGVFLSFFLCTLINTSGILWGMYITYRFAHSKNTPYHFKCILYKQPPPCSLRPKILPPKSVANKYSNPPPPPVPRIKHHESRPNSATHKFTPCPHRREKGKRKKTPNARKIRTSSMTVPQYDRVHVIKKLQTDGPPKPKRTTQIQEKQPRPAPNFDSPS
jgi:hypothetical protein